MSDLRVVRFKGLGKLLNRHDHIGQGISYLMGYAGGYPAGKGKFLGANHIILAVAQVGIRIFELCTGLGEFVNQGLGLTHIPGAENNTFDSALMVAVSGDIDLHGNFFFPPVQIYHLRILPRNDSRYFLEG